MGKRQADRQLSREDLNSSEEEVGTFEREALNIAIISRS